jgi:hypothetical protein
MGDDSGTLHPFGETRTSAFSKLLADLPPRGYPARRFFKVAIETDELADGWFNMYLDLARSNGDDAALVMFEAPLDSGESDLPAEPLSFLETVIEHIFLTVDVAPKDYSARIFVHGDDPWRGMEIKREVVRRLIDGGFVLMLPDLPRVTCVSRGPVSILITDSDTSELVDVRFGGDDLEATDSAVRPLLSAVAGAHLYQTPARRDAEADI